MAHASVGWRHLRTDLNQTWCVCRSRQRNHVYQTWYNNSQWLFQADKLKNVCFTIGNHRPIKHCQAQMCCDVSRGVMGTNLQLNSNRNVYVTKVVQQYNSII